MTNFFTVVLIAIAFGLGLVVGETYAPISGSTVQKLDARLTTAEGDLGVVRLECKAAQTRIDQLASHFTDAKLER